MRAVPDDATSIPTELHVLRGEFPTSEGILAAFATLGIVDAPEEMLVDPVAFVRDAEQLLRAPRLSRRLGPYHKLPELMRGTFHQNWGSADTGWRARIERINPSPGMRAALTDEIDALLSSGATEGEIAAVLERDGDYYFNPVGNCGSYGGFLCELREVLTDNTGPGPETNSDEPSKS